jgi:hypothetical protein
MDASTSSGDFVGPSSADAGARLSGAGTNNWLNLAFLSIGAVAAIGLLVVLFGAYVMRPGNDGVIIAGAIVLLAAVVAWIFVALFMVGHLLRQLVTSRRDKKLREPRPQ